MANNRSSSFFGGLLVGATLGTVAGLIAAPRSGRETRYLLKKSADALPELAEDLSTNLQIQADRLSESALRSWDETLLRLREAIAAGLEASQQTRQQLSQGSTAGSHASSSLLRPKEKANYSLEDPLAPSQQGRLGPPGRKPGRSVSP